MALYEQLKVFCVQCSLPELRIIVSHCIRYSRYYSQLRNKKINTYIKQLKKASGIHKVLTSCILVCSVYKNRLDSYSVAKMSK